LREAHKAVLSHSFQESVASCARKKAMDQRLHIKFELDKTAPETDEMLLRVYGQDAVSRKCVHDWSARFCASGRPYPQAGKHRTRASKRPAIDSAINSRRSGYYQRHSGSHEDLGKRKICLGVSRSRDSYLNMVQKKKKFF